MEHRIFQKKFGGAFRTKNINSPLDVVHAKTLKNCRSYLMQGGNEIPAEFIRMEPWEGEYLFMIASRAKQGIVEVGRYNGGSLFLMACANPTVPIWSIDIAPQNDELLQSVFADTRVGSNAHLIVGDSQNTKYPEVREFDVLFIDGDHSYDGCIADLKNWFNELSVGGHIVLHDCYNGSEVLDAVLDFAAEHPVRFVNSPYIIGQHWFVPTGSLVHMLKLA